VSFFSMLRQDSAWARRKGLLFGINRRNVELVYACNPRRHYPLADDKLRCKELLVAQGIPVAPTIAVCRGLFEVERVVATLRDKQDFVVKPAGGSGGDGIAVVGSRTATGWRGSAERYISEGELRQHLANIVFGAFSKQLEDKALVEERIRPHAWLNTLWSDGVCDIRIISHEGKSALAMLRVPTLRSEGRANLHRGGIGVAIALDSGITTRAVLNGKAIRVHPETGANLVGCRVPHWKECVAIARRIARGVPLGYLGIDMTIDEDRGPLVLEINARPGLEIQNVTHTLLGEVIPGAAS